MRGTGGAVINSSRLTAAGFSVGQRGNSVVDGVGRQRGIEVIRCFLEEIHFLPSAGSESAGLRTAVSRGSGDSVRLNTDRSSARPARVESSVDGGKSPRARGYLL